MTTAKRKRAKTKRTKKGKIRGRPAKEKIAEQAARPSPPARKPRWKALSVNMDEPFRQVPIDTPLIVMADMGEPNPRASIDALFIIRAKKAELAHLNDDPLRGRVTLGRKIGRKEEADILAKRIENQTGAKVDKDYIEKQLQIYRRYEDQQIDDRKELILCLLAILPLPGEKLDVSIERVRRCLPGHHCVFSFTTIRRFLKRHGEDRQIDEHKEVILSLLSERPNISFEEMRQALSSQCPRFNFNTIRRFLKRHRREIEKGGRARG